MKVIILPCLCAVMVESFLNGVGQLAADHSTTTLRIIIVATVELFLDLMYLPVVVRMSIRQVRKFAAAVRYCQETVVHTAVVPLTTILQVRYVVVMSSYPNHLVRAVAIHKITILHITSAVLEMFYQNHPEHIAVGPLILIHLIPYAVETKFGQKHLVHIAALVGVYITVHITMVFLSAQASQFVAGEAFFQGLQA